MSVSRRKFMKAGILATVCAGLPLKLAGAMSGPEGRRVPLIARPDGQPSPAWQTQTATSQELLDYYTKSTFDPYVNTKFLVHLGSSNIRSLTLQRTEDYLQSSSKGAAAIAAGEECFSLLLVVKPGKPFEQGTYTIEHPALGAFPMFLVAVNKHTKSSPDYYEAIVYRRQRSSGEPEPNVISDAQRAASGVSIQPTQNWWVVPGGGAANATSGKLKEKIERETFNIELLTSGASALTEKKKAVRANWLSMAQGLNVSGLKLGMTTEQVLALFPGSKTDKDVRVDLDRPPTRFGVSTFTIRPERYELKSDFNNISQIVFTLLDGRVSTLYVGYDAPLWEHVDEFVTTFSQGRNMPEADSWEAHVGMDDQLKTLQCKDFEVALFAGGKNLAINYVQLRDLTALQKYKERRAKARKTT